MRAGVDRAAPAGRRLDDAVAFGAERRAQEAPDLRLVLDDQDAWRAARHRRRGASAGTAGGASSGSVKRNAVPPPGTRSAQILPPCSRTIARQIARPSPTPPPRLRRAAVELGEHALEVAVGQAGAEVLDRDDELAAAALRAQPDQRCPAACAARRSRAGCRAPARSASRPRAPAAGRRAARPSPGAPPAARAGARSTEPAISASDAQSRSSSMRAGLEARHLQHLGDLLRHLARLRRRRSARARARSSARQPLAALGEARRGARHHRERRAQVVRDRGEQRAADALGLGLERERGLRLGLRGARSRSGPR